MKRKKALVKTVYFVVSPVFHDLSVFVLSVLSVTQ